MPNITVQLLAGRDINQRRAFVQDVTNSAVLTLGARRDDVRIVFEEITPDIVANGGVFASEDESRAEVVSRFVPEASA
ncbi:4-oxalocrotonate tautomerase [Cryobacterium sp. LW097]|uniref:tautomerase family protein n=1 Tax=Cryobacterium sp. LW097 TaxID=1978566 RepID=UPI000B4C822C|nr:tautomerase family protein [Cryobacterium sp. LW097]ASD23672.1 4-oxalocrotonate tautomerase [Cryobacterium sp. LW097]